VYSVHEKRRFKGVSIYLQIDAVRDTGFYLKIAVRFFAIDMVTLLKTRGLRMTAQKQETLLKLTVLSLAAILCTFVFIFVL